MLSYISRSKTVTDTYCKILSQADELHKHYQLLITDGEIDRSLAWASIRFEGRREFQYGTAVKIFYNYHDQLVIDWGHRQTSRVFVNIPNQKDVYEQVKSLLSLVEIFDNAPPYIPLKVKKGCRILREGEEPAPGEFSKICTGSCGHCRCRFAFDKDEPIPWPLHNVTAQCMGGGKYVVCPCCKSDVGV